jgi:hypothetical protein
MAQRSLAESFPQKNTGNPLKRYSPQATRILICHGLIGINGISGAL